MRSIKRKSLNSSIKYLNFNIMDKEILLEGKKCRILSYWKYKNSNGLMFSMNAKGQIFFGVNIQRKFFYINHDKLETKALMYHIMIIFILSLSTSLIKTMTMLLKLPRQVVSTQSNKTTRLLKSISIWE